MADAVSLARLTGAKAVNRALGHAAVYGRFATDDLAAIIAHHATATAGEPARAGEDYSLQPGTARWEGFGQ
jgi:hypothetical protein